MLRARFDHVGLGGLTAATMILLTAAVLGVSSTALAQTPVVNPADAVPIAWVDDDPTLMTLQQAFNTPGSGHTVHVVQGDFTFKSTTVLTVPRQVTLTSPGPSEITARFSVTGGGLTTTSQITLHPASTSAVVSASSGVQLTGLTVKNTAGVLRPTGIQLAALATGVSIDRFTMDGGDQPLSYGVNLTTGSASITDASISGVATGIGITAASTASGISVVRGAFNVLTVGIALGTARGPTVSGAVVAGTGVGTGVDLANSSDGSVSATMVTGFARGIATNLTNEAGGPDIRKAIVQQVGKEGIALGSTTGAIITAPAITGTDAAFSSGINVYKASGVKLDRVVVSHYTNGVTTSADGTGAGPEITSPLITDVTSGILLGSTQGASVTDAQLSGSAPGGGINTQNAGAVTVSNARITGFLYGVAAQSVGLGTPGRRNYALTDITVVGAAGASSGIYLQGTTDARIENLDADVGSGGIVLHEATDTVAKHVVVTGHEAASPTAGSAIVRAYNSDGIALDDASIGAGAYGLYLSATTNATFTNVRVSGVVEYGLYARSSSHLDVSASTFQRNAGMGSLVIRTPSEGVSHDVDIHDNLITGNGRGLSVYTGTRRVTFARNRVSGAGYAVYASPAHDLLIDANEIDFTSADATEGAIRIGSSYANPDTVRLLRSRARAVTRDALERELGRNYTQRSTGLRIGCSQRSRVVVACRVAWTGPRGSYSGVVTVRGLGATRWRYALRVRARSGKALSRVGRIGRRGAADYTSSNIRVLSNKFTGAGTFIQAGSPNGTDDVLSDIVEVSGNVFPKDSIAIRAYPNAEQDVTGDPPTDGITAIDARDSGSRGANDFGSPCRAQVTSGAAQDQTDPAIYEGGGAWIHETREPQVLYPETCPVDMRVTKLVSPPSAAPGQAIEWIIGVVNDGSALARNVVLQDTLPAGFTIAGFDTTDGSAVCELAGQQLRCTLGDVPPGSGALIAVRGSAAGPGTLENTATASSTTRESDLSNNTARASVDVPAAPVPVPAPGGELTVTKTVDRTIAYVGEPVTYTLRVRNTGAGPTAPVLVADLFSAPVEIVSIDVDDGRCQTTRPIVCTVGPLNPGDAVTVRITAIPLVPGILRNAGAASGSVNVLVPPFAGRLPNFAVAQVSVRSARPELVLQKTPRQVTRQPGERVTHQLVVTSRRADARDLRVCDRPGPGLQVVRAPGARRDAAGACWTIRRLARGATRRLEITLRVVPGQANGTILNRAFARATGTRTVRAQARVYVSGPSACSSTLHERAAMAC